MISNTVYQSNDKFRLETLKKIHGKTCIRNSSQEHYKEITYFLVQLYFDAIYATLLRNKKKHNILM